MKKDVSVGQLVTVIFVVILVAIFILPNFTMKINQQATEQLKKINNQVAIDAVNQYNIAKQHGDLIQICVQAGLVTAAYLQAQDTINYGRWKDIEMVDCTNSGSRTVNTSISNEPRVVSMPMSEPRMVTAPILNSESKIVSHIEEKLGRLFMDAEERAKLNLLRSQPPMPTVEEQFNSFLPDPPHYITFKGAIVHEDGSTVVWISDGNGLYPPNTLYQPSFSIKLDNTLKNQLLLLVTLPKGNKKRWLKLGQTLDTVDDKIIEESQNVN
ncbi:MAG: hypothetical protein BWK79_03690 [Beggiatoa sp. IS2]|nr:MAG: hypothetical protein BWK79_03690 [Beggiatoa sp. IS2]